MGPGDAGKPTSEAGADGGADAALAGDAAGETAGAGILAGTVKDKAGVVVAGATVAVGGGSAISDIKGAYRLEGVPVGPATVRVTRTWFTPLEQTTVVATGTTALDLTIEEIAMKIDPADRTVADGYNKMFDWTKATLSIAVVARPTRRDFDNAVYLRNPALYRDRSKDPPVTPNPAPAFAGTTPMNFSFKIPSGKNLGQEALDLASIADAIGTTPLGATEPADFMMWSPVVNWLSEAEGEKAADLRAVGAAVRQQPWGSDAIRAQEIEKVYLDATGAIWVKVVFANFLQLPASIHDDDGDGQKEIYAKIASPHYTPALVERLRTDYAARTFNTHGLSLELAKSLSELYSTTMASVERTIGQRYELPGGIGVIVHPFVVLKHAGGQRNVFLVAPAP